MRYLLLVPGILLAGCGAIETGEGNPAGLARVYGHEDLAAITWAAEELEAACDAAAHDLDTRWTTDPYTADPLKLSSLRYLDEPLREYLDEMRSLGPDFNRELALELLYRIPEEQLPITRAEAVEILMDLGHDAMDMVYHLAALATMKGVLVISQSISLFLASNSPWVGVFYTAAGTLGPGVLLFVGIWTGVALCGGIDLAYVQRAITYGYLFELFGRDMHGVETIRQGLLSWSVSDHLETWFTHGYFRNLSWKLAGSPPGDFPPELSWKSWSFTRHPDNVENMGEIIAWLERYKRHLYFAIDELRIERGPEAFPAIQMAVNSGITTVGCSRGFRLEERDYLRENLVMNLRSHVFTTQEILVDILAESQDEGCQPGEYRCGDGECLPGEWLCDGWVDCADASDEADCGGGACGPDEYQCLAGNCIYASWECDGYDDCAGGEDELFCGWDEGCREDEFTCDDGTCIYGVWECDGYDDCAGGEDEWYCW
jgi:hypothetical protein